MFSVLTLKPYDFYMKPEMKGHFELARWFHAPGSRAALKAGTGTVTYVPNNLHSAALDRIQAHGPHVFFGTCTPPDSNGFVSLSLGITYEKDIIEAAKTVVLEVNPHLPRTFGDTHLNVSAVDRFVMNDQEVPTLPDPPRRPRTSPSAATSESSSRTARRSSSASAASPTRSPSPCGTSSDLGVHTEMMVDSVMELYEIGVVTN